MDEVFKYQESLTDSIIKENARVEEIDKPYDIDLTINQAREYHERVIHLKQSLSALKERSKKLRQRTYKILERKNKDDLERQRSKERREMLERHLEPVVNTKGD